MVCTCGLYSRIHDPEQLGRHFNGFWQPGKQLGMVMDVVAMVFLVIVGILSWSVFNAMEIGRFFLCVVGDRLTVASIPYATHPNAAGWNYAPFLVLGVTVIGLLVWFASAHKYYHPGQ